MRFSSAYCSDIGIKKSVNQDAMLLFHAQPEPDDDVVFAAVFDGVGGLQMGERASAVAAGAFQRWFDRSIPALYGMERPEGTLFEEWKRELLIVHEELIQFSGEQGLRLGTTADLLLIMHGHYYIGHVGDGRVYTVTDTLHQLTTDHTIVQQEVDAGELTPEQARKDKRQNLLLQCVGAGRYLQPDFLMGNVEPDQPFLVCCDGFRRRITNQELEGVCNTSGKESKMHLSLERSTQLCKNRKETDNITSILIRSIPQKRWPLSLMRRPQKSGSHEINWEQVTLCKRVIIQCE